MGILDELLGGNGAALAQVGGQLGLDPAQTRAAIEALTPMVMAGVSRQAQSGAGLDGLLGSLAGTGLGGYVSDPATLGAPAAVEDGNSILGQIFGSKAVSREVASRASAQTGIGADVLKALLPIVASAVMSAMVNRASGAPGGSPAGPVTAGSGGGLLDMLTPMIDADRDGSVMDDLAGIMGKYLSGR